MNIQEMSAERWKQYKWIKWKCQKKKCNIISEVFIPWDQKQPGQSESKRSINLKIIEIL